MSHHAPALALRPVPRSRRLTLPQAAEVRAAIDALRAEIQVLSRRVELAEGHAARPRQAAAAA